MRAERGHAAEEFSSSLQLASQRKMPTHTCELLVCVCKTTMAIYSLHFACCRLWSACRGSATLCLPDALQLQELFLEVGLGSAKGEASRRWLCLINVFHRIMSPRCQVWQLLISPTGRSSVSSDSAGDAFSQVCDPCKLGTYTA